MNQLIALVALSVLSIIATLSNYWLTFGLWPRSGFAFVFFAIANTLILALINFVSKNK